MSVSRCKTAQCDGAGCDARMTFIGYHEAQNAVQILRESGWSVRESKWWVGQGAALTFCPLHAGEF